MLEPELERLAADPNDEIRLIVIQTLRSKPDPKFAKVNVVVQKRGDGLVVSQRPIADMPEDLKQLLEG